MPKAVLAYLTQRADTSTFLVPSELSKTLEELFGRSKHLLPQPYKIFPVDETQPPSLGFPLAESSVMKELDTKLDKWLHEEVWWQVSRQSQAKEKAQFTFNLYQSHLLRVAENALMSNLLNDYHAVFWLAHSFDLARQFSTIPRRISAIDAQTGRTQGDAVKYRIFSRWVSETRDGMTNLATKAASILDGEEQRGLQFFRLLQDDVLIFTEEFIGPDLRELRSFITGYLRRDFQAFRDGFEKLRTTAGELLTKDRTFRAALPQFGGNPDQGITLALLLDGRFQSFLFEHATIQNVMTREDREQVQLITRRAREFVVLNQLRRGIVWMTTSGQGEIVSTDRRNGVSFSRSTRPMDFGRPGVVDPMVHRFGLIYDISAFSETLGNIRRGGGKEEVKSYRQMLLFQRKLETIATRHLLVFEKFLGDGAFYTTRRALRLIRAAVEIQRFYAEMKRKGFAFNKGMRVALNYGYYRLLPMRVSHDSADRITEFYGPGIVELSRLTTGKANKEIEEIGAFLVSRGYDARKVQTFFAPLARGVDVIDHIQHARDFYAYINSNGNLINEGIVASLDFVQELSGELLGEAQQIFKLRASWGTYIGFAPLVSGLEFIGLRLLGSVSLKGLDDVEVAEIVPFAPGEVEAVPIESSETLVTLLRHDFHQPGEEEIPIAREDVATTTERVVSNEIVICAKAAPNGGEDEVLIGVWDPLSDDIRKPLRLHRSEFVRLFEYEGDLTAEQLDEKKDLLRDAYARLSKGVVNDSLPLADFRMGNEYDAYVLGDVVEKL